MSCDRWDGKDALGCVVGEGEVEEPTLLLGEEVIAVVGELVAEEHA